MNTNQYYSRINAYRIMWLYVFFDLPTGTKKERKAYQDFRDKLMKDGFSMKQYSVYARYCISREEVDVHLRRINLMVPDKGKISVLTITDKQFSSVVNYWGKNLLPPEEAPSQLLLF